MTKHIKNEWTNKANSSMPLLETHKSIEKNKSGLQTKTEGNASNITGEQRHNRNTTLKCNTHRNELSIRQNLMRITNISDKRQ